MLTKIFVTAKLITFFSVFSIFFTMFLVNQGGPLRRLSIDKFTSQDDSFLFKHVVACVLILAFFVVTVAVVERPEFFLIVSYSLCRVVTFCASFIYGTFFSFFIFGW